MNKNSRMRSLYLYHNNSGRINKRIEKKKKACRVQQLTSGKRILGFLFNVEQTTANTITITSYKIVVKLMAKHNKHH